MAERMVYWMFVLGWNFVSDLICVQKSKKTKNLKTFSRNLGFSSPGCSTVVNSNNCSEVHSAHDTDDRQGGGVL